MKNLRPLSFALPFAHPELTGSPLHSLGAFYMSDCIICGEQLRGQKFLNSTICSISCYNKHRAVKYVDRYCIVCGEKIKFIPEKGTKGYSKKLYCSSKCNGYSKQNQITKVCPTCGKTYSVKKSKENKYNYCSVECRPKRLSEISCIVCGNHFIVKNSQAEQRLLCSKKCQNIYATTKTGNKNNNWRGGIHPINMIGRTTIAYNNWRINVFIRDNRECQKCGSKKDIQAHHIKPWSQFKNVRLDINNGITLCKKCHAKTHLQKGNDFFSPTLNYNNQKKNVLSNEPMPI